jgi:hypothetical protein
MWTDCLENVRSSTSYKSMGLHGLFEDSLTFLYVDEFVPHRKYIYGPSRPVARIVLLSYMYIMFEPHRKHMYGSPRLVTGIAVVRLLCFLS